jgi:isopenicillin-N N-acyltransferase like protein
LSALPIPFVSAEGSPREAGFRHGAARAEALRAFLDDGLARLAHLMPASKTAAPITLAALRPTIAAYDAEISAAVPDLAEEISGLAEGAGITREEALLLQLRREIMGYSKVPTMGDCTTYACVGVGDGAADSASDGYPVLAQTVDLNGGLDDQLAVLEVHRPGSPRRALVLSFGGLLGYLGVNSDGLAVGLNLVLGGDWHPGLPPYLAIRHLLDTAPDVDTALTLLGGLKLAGSRSLTLCDRDRCVSVEFLGDEMRVLAQPDAGTGTGTDAIAAITHTNHFLHPDFTARDELNIFARNSSVLRLKACRAGLAALPPDPGVEDHFAVLTNSPICVADTGDLRRERTVAAVVMLPRRAELHVRPGDPSRSGTQSFTLHGSG